MANPQDEDPHITMKRADIANGFFAFLMTAREAIDRLNSRDAAREAEDARVQALLDREAAEREAERRRQLAEIEIEEGRFVNLDDTVVPPTPELISKGDFDLYTPKGEDGTVRTVSTLRRRMKSQLVILYSRGVLDDDLLAACKWYRDRYEAAELEPSAPVAQYGETVRGDPVYGHLPRTQWGAEARADFRWARKFIPADVRNVFEFVILKDMTMKDAARAARCRYANIQAAFRRAALELHGGIANRLEIDPRKGVSSQRLDFMGTEIHTHSG